ncbi:MAG: Kelch repeat-containing protein, partial [Thermomicrobiales bacterium]
MAAPRARAENLWTPAAPMTQTHLDHTATLLRDGTVLVTGGYFATNGPLAERYDPAANRWSPAGRLAVQRFQQTATLLNDGRVLVVGGTTYQAELPQDDTLGRAELYDPATSTWSLTEPVAPQRLAPDGLTGHTATLLPDGRVLV